MREHIMISWSMYVFKGVFVFTILRTQHLASINLRVYKYMILFSNGLVNVPALNCLILSYCFGLNIEVVFLFVCFVCFFGKLFTVRFAHSATCFQPINHTHARTPWSPSLAVAVGRCTVGRFSYTLVVVPGEHFIMCVRVWFCCAGVGCDTSSHPILILCIRLHTFTTTIARASRHPFRPHADSASLRPAAIHLSISICSLLI